MSSGLGKVAKKKLLCFPTSRVELHELFVSPGAEEFSCTSCQLSFWHLLGSPRAKTLKRRILPGGSRFCHKGFCHFPMRLAC